MQYKYLADIMVCYFSLLKMYIGKQLGMIYIQAMLLLCKNSFAVFNLSKGHDIIYQPNTSQSMPGESGSGGKFSDLWETKLS